MNTSVINLTKRVADSSTVDQTIELASRIERKASGEDFRELRSRLFHLIADREHRRKTRV